MGFECQFTGRLRWVVTNGKQVLQQEVLNYGKNDYDDEESTWLKWQDVPTESPSK